MTTVQLFWKASREGKLELAINLANSILRQCEHLGDETRALVWRRNIDAIERRLP